MTPHHPSSLDLLQASLMASVMLMGPDVSTDTHQKALTN
jgi:hypothetical protein